MTKTEEMTKKILNSPALKDMEPLETLSALENMMKALAKIDCTDQDMFYIMNKKKSILKWSIEEIERNLADMIKFGYDKKAIRRMVKDNPDVLSFPLEKYASSLTIFSAFGLTKEEFLRVTRDNTKLLDYTLDMLLDKRADIMSISFGEDRSVRFDEHDFKTLLINDSSFLSISISTIESHIDNFRSFDYTEEEIRKIIMTIPGIATRSVDTIREKLSVVRTLGLRHVIPDNPVRLRQSAHLTKAKATYLINHDVFIKSPTGINYLFSSSKDFKSAFCVDHKGVEALYDLQMELQEKRLQMGIKEESNPWAY